MSSRSEGYQILLSSKEVPLVQLGEIRWQYTITSRQDCKDTEALKFALGDRVQAYARVLPAGRVDNRTMQGSLLEIGDCNLTVTSITPAREKGFLILMVRETSGLESRTLRVSSKGKAIRFDEVNAIEEVIRARRDEIEIPPYGCVLIRIKSGK